MQINAQNVKWVYDTIYSPPETEFLKSFPNVKKANGYGMLILQAVQADRIMCEKEISKSQENEIYELAMARITKGERQ
jgi:shikimate 5-dehydrogenase